MRFWWSWWVLPPRPIVNFSDDYRLRLFGILTSGFKQPKNYWRNPGNLSQISADY
jgi:hypothetical protein